MAEEQRADRRDQWRKLLYGENESYRSILRDAGILTGEDAVRSLLTDEP